MNTRSSYPGALYVKNLAFLLVKLPAAILLGGVVALGFVQNDAWVKGLLEKRIISTMSTILGESCKVAVDEIDLLRGEIILRDLVTGSSQKSWSLRCPEVHVYVSWLSWLKRQKFDTTVSFEKPVIFSAYSQGSLAIAKPFQDFLAAPFTVPLTLTKCLVKGSVARVENETGELLFHGGLTTSVEPGHVLTNLVVSDGYLRRHKSLLAERLAGRLTIDVPRTDEPAVCTLKASAVRPTSVGDLSYNLYGRYADGKGICHCRSEDGSLSFEAHTRNEGQETVGEVSIAGTLGEIVSCVVDDPAVCQATGDTQFSGTVTLGSTGYRYKGQAVIENAQYRGVTLASAHVNLEGDDREVQVAIADAEASGIGLKGSLTGRFASKEVSGSLSFAHPYEGIPRCKLEKGRSTIYYKDDVLKAEFKVDSTLFDSSKLPLRGSLTTDFRTAKIAGNAGGNPVHLEFAWNPFALTKLSVSDPLHQKRIKFEKAESSEALMGTIDSLVIKKLVTALTGHQLSGSLEVQVCKDGQRIEFSVKDASLKIPGTYTVIKEISGSLAYDFAKRMVKVHDLMVIMHKGFAWSSCATFTFNEQGGVASAHIPVLCKDLLISKQKELFGTISGGITLTNSAGAWRCSGLLMIENAHLRSNLLSSQVQKELMQATIFAPEEGGRDMDLDLHVQSRGPLKVQTSFLTTDAHVDMKIKGKTARPEIEGAIELVHGSFDFPYKPLFVSHGKLILAPHQPEGPVIALTAKNKIRAYTVTMTVSGTLQQPHVRFEASPQLPEEAIITLLLTGSDHGSLSAAMPRVVMEQIEDVIFGSEEKLSAAQQVLKGLLTPLKNVRLVKKGAAQDDLQAVLEVDINDRLRAKAQNSLTLSDDTQLELEYTVSDDVRVKAVRDQEGGLGGEVEMRWKF